MKQICFRLSLVLLFCGMAVLSGCAAQRPLRLEPVNKKAATAIQPLFTEAYYRVDRDQNLYFVMRDKGTDRATGQPVEQIVTIRMFWQPIGGRTSLDPAALNATFRYIALTPYTAGLYEGAGFVRIDQDPGRRTLTARVIDGDLRLAEATAQFNDTLGRSRIRGTFSAKLSDAKTMDMLLAAHRTFFTRSLAISQNPEPAATAPTTAPSTPGPVIPPATTQASEPVRP